MNFNQRWNRKKRKNYFMVTICLIVGIFCSLDLSAQDTLHRQMQQQEVKTDFSSNQLKAFVNANQKLLPVQQNSQEKMMESIKKAGLTIDRFNEIAQAQLQGKKMDVSATETVAFNNAVKEVMKQKEETEPQMEEIIEKEGLDVKTFQQIADSYQQSPEIQQKVNTLMQSKDNK